MDIFERAGHTLELLSAHGLGQRPLIFIAHSLGGILSKILLRQSRESSDEGWRSISEQTTLVVFLATPHLGAQLASLGKIIPGSSKHITLLANESGWLEDINSAYRSLAEQRSDLKTVVYYEKYKTKGMALVVSRASADPGVVRCTPVAQDKDHLSICKPTSTEDMLHLGVRRHVVQALKVCPTAQNGSIAENYEEKHETDRRSLLDKLIDADREHEYPTANDSQNAFARKYIKTGLMTAARSDHDSMLSDVHSRFVIHVYNPLICKGRSDEHILDALQAKVIDPVSEKTFGAAKFSPKVVLDGLYYLTEQCHIRWDKP